MHTLHYSKCYSVPQHFHKYHRAISRRVLLQTGCNVYMNHKSEFSLCIADINKQLVDARAAPPPPSGSDLHTAQMFHSHGNVTLPRVPFPP